MNGDWVRKLSVAMEKRILKSSQNSDPTRIVNEAFELAVGRNIETDEIPVAVDLLQQTLAAGKTRTNTEDFGSLAEDSGDSVSIGEHALPALAT